MRYFKSGALIKLSRTEATVLLILLLFNLRVMSWFQYPYIWSSGDLRSPFVNEAVMKRSFYVWDNTDFGMPSVYPPRLLNPFFALNISLQALGLSLSFSQVITVFLVYFFVSALMYALVKQLTNGDVIASLIASLYLSSNVYLVNDREISAISFMMSVFLILPSLITFVKGIKKNSNKIMALSGILCALSCADFPNYRLTLTCMLTLFFLLIFLLVEGRSKCSQFKDSVLIYMVRLLVVFSVACVLALMSVLALVYLNFDTFVKAYAELSPSKYKPRIFDVMRLVVMWTFYPSTYGRPFLPYGNAYLNSPLIVLLCCLPAILAFASLLFSKEKAVLYFSILALISILLTSGFSFVGGVSDPYAFLVNLPLLKAFRGAYNWVFFLVFSFSILIGCTTSHLYRRLKGKKTRFTVIGLVVAVFLLTAYPLITGDVTRNWIDPRIRGTLLPRSYYELNGALPNDYWGLLLPQRHVYVAYNFSGVPFQVGNPYPLIFSKPIISGVGTEYIRSESAGLIEEVYRRVQGGVIGEETSKFLGMFGVKYLVLEKSFIFGNKFSVDRLSALFRESRYLRLVEEWDEIDLFENAFALQRIYVADKVLVCENVAGMFGFLRELDWETLKRSAFVGSASDIGSHGVLSLPVEFSWREVSPVRYEVIVKSDGPFLLVLLESYDGMWKVYVNGVQVPETNHVKVNMFANGWIIDATGPLNILIQYEAQLFFERSVLFSLFSQVFLLAYLGRREVVAVILKFSGFVWRSLERFNLV